MENLLVDELFGSSSTTELLRSKSEGGKENEVFFDFAALGKRRELRSLLHLRFNKLKLGK